MTSPAARPAFAFAFAAALAPLPSLTGCSGTQGGSPPAAAPDGGAPDAGPALDAGGDAGSAGASYVNREEAPAYDGKAFAHMQVLDQTTGSWLDEAALVAALGDERLVLMGEQHETAPVQELELWLLTRLAARHADLALAMEHFQRDEQPVLDRYLAGQIDAAEFERTAQPWKNYAKYWKPLVDHMKTEGRKVVALNVPDEALQTIYGSYPQKPLAVFNGFGAGFKYDAALPPRPLPAYDAAYKDYFETSFDYTAHGQGMGMTYAEALDYFTDLAHVRDEAMSYWAWKQLEAGGHLFVVAGDWHVQTGLATPDRAVRWSSGALPGYALVTTTPSGKLGTVAGKTISGRKLARFVLVYEAK